MQKPVLLTSEDRSKKLFTYEGRVVVLPLKNQDGSTNNIPAIIPNGDTKTVEATFETLNKYFGSRLEWFDWRTFNTLITNRSEISYGCLRKRRSGAVQSYDVIASQNTIPLANNGDTVLVTFWRTGTTGPVDIFWCNKLSTPLLQPSKGRKSFEKPKRYNYNPKGQAAEGSDILDSTDANQELVEA